MKIPIEIAAVFVIFLIWFVWMVWYKLSLKKLRRRYNPEDDLAKKGEERRKATTTNQPGRSRGNESKSFNTSGPNKSKGRGSIQKRSTDSVKKNSRSIRKPVNPFRRRK